MDQDKEVKSRLYQANTKGGQQTQRAQAARWRAAPRCGVVLPAGLSGLRSQAVEAALRRFFRGESMEQLQPEARKKSSWRTARERSSQEKSRGGALGVAFFC